MQNFIMILILLFITLPAFASDDFNNSYEKHQEQVRLEQRQYEQKLQEQRLEDKSRRNRIYQRQLDKYYIEKRNNDSPYPIQMPARPTYNYW